MDTAINPLTHWGHPFIYAGMNAAMKAAMNVTVFLFSPKLTYNFDSQESDE